MSVRKDLNGKIFGKLTVLQFHGLSKHSRAKWKCKCECGKIKIVGGEYLRTGDTKSCGSTGCRQNSKNLIGKTFGRLIVLQLINKQKWLCRCLCGNEKIIDGQSLYKGRTKSCGCLREEIRLRRINEYRSKTEIFLGNFIESKYNIKLERSFVLENKVYDFKYKSILIESDGSYWHSSKNQRKNDNIKNRLAKKYGFTLIRFQLDRPSDVSKKWNLIKKQLNKHIL